MAQASTVLNFETSTELLYTMRRILRVTAIAIRASGLTRRQYDLLLILEKSAASLSIGEAAQCLEIRHHSAVGLASRTERLGFLRRQRKGRQVVLELTEKGLRALQTVSQQQHDNLRDVAPALLIGVTRTLGEINRLYPRDVSVSRLPII